MAGLKYKKYIIDQYMASEHEKAKRCGEAG